MGRIAVAGGWLVMLALAVAAAQAGAAPVTVLPSGRLVPPPESTITVSPMYTRPGSQVDLRVEVCDPGTVAVSPAFARPVRLSTTADGRLFGTADIGRDTPDGAYE